MVKHENKWGTVCDDSFGLTDAEAACKTLGFTGGSYQGRQFTRFPYSLPTWMDEYQLYSNETYEPRYILLNLNLFVF